MRRDKNDEKWQSVKKTVKKRDKNICQICRCLTGDEAIKSRKDAVLITFSIIDPAHIYPVSKYPEIMYEADNIMCLCRHHHSLIDNYKDPITGENIDENKVFYWWWRAKNSITDKYDETQDYKELLKQKYKRKSSFDDFLE